MPYHSSNSNISTLLQMINASKALNNCKMTVLCFVTTSHGEYLLTFWPTLFQDKLGCYTMDGIHKTSFKHRKTNNRERMPYHSSNRNISTLLQMINASKALNNFKMTVLCFVTASQGEHLQTFSPTLFQDKGGCHTDQVITIFQPSVSLVRHPRPKKTTVR